MFFAGAAAVFLLLTREFSISQLLSRLAPASGLLLFLAIAAPWHILAGLRNTGGADGHGFLWFYFINEHVLRFLGRRIPRDYNKLPFALYWLLHVVWLFPWSLFGPTAAVVAWRRRSELRLLAGPIAGPRAGPRAQTRSFGQQTVLLLAIFSALVLLFFAFSTNQEYYTFPVYLPLLMLIAAALAYLQEGGSNGTAKRAIRFGFVAFAVVGLGAAAALGYGLWTSRHLPFVPDVGNLLAHRGVGDYTLSMSHFFDLTTASFAALRMPASLAASALAFGSISVLLFEARKRTPARFQTALLTLSVVSAVFLIAAHIALLRFAPMLSSRSFATQVRNLEADGSAAHDSQVLLYGDQSFGSSIPFYLDRQVLLVDGRSTSMLFGSTFHDAPPLFLSSQDLAREWGTGPRKLLFVPLEKRGEVDALLGHREIIVGESSGKALVTDRPLSSAVAHLRH